MINLIVQLYKIFPVLSFPSLLCLWFTCINCPSVAYLIEYFNLPKATLYSLPQLALSPRKYSILNPHPLTTSQPHFKSYPKTHALDINHLKVIIFRLFSVWVQASLRKCYNHCSLGNT